MTRPRLLCLSLQLASLLLPACTRVEGNGADTACTPESGYLDSDGDGFGDSAGWTARCPPHDLVSEGGDCDDSDPDVHPSASELCDGVDNDCDGLTDAEDPNLADGETRYTDADGDGVGADGSGTPGCDAEDGVLADGDCDDADASVYPGAHDTCNDGIDQDCDGEDRSCDLTDATPVEDADVVVRESGEYIDTGVGREVRFVGDVLGTETDSLGLGVPFDSTNGYHCGVLYLFGAVSYHGADVGLGEARVRILGDEVGDNAGNLLTFSGIGDFDGDGYDDLLASMEGDPADGYRERGSAYVFTGPLSGTYLPADAATWIPGPPVADLGFGTGSSGGLDIDGDGYSDLLLASFPWPDPAVESVGIAYVVSGPATGTVDVEDVEASLVGETPWAAFAISTAIGDLDADGQADVVIDETGDDTVYVFHGPITGTRFAGDADVELGDVARNGYSKEPVAADLNGDGTMDLLVGAPRERGGGAAYVLRGPLTGGSANIGDVAWARLAWNNPITGFLGYSTSAGDVDGDGLSDILLGEPVGGEEGLGTAFLVYGPVTGEVDVVAEGVTYTGTEADAQVGYSVGVGDMDGDGLDDQAIGAPQHDGIPGSAGAVYLFFGEP